MAAKGGTTAVVTALLGNLTIAAFKYFAAYVSGSSSMLAEGHHSLADTANQVLLLVGIHRSRRGPSARHPFGMGKDEALVAVDVVFEPETTVAELEGVVDRIEARIREVVPGARCYIEAESLKAPLHGQK